MIGGGLDQGKGNLTYRLCFSFSLPPPANLFQKPILQVADAPVALRLAAFSSETRLGGRMAGHSWQQGWSVRVRLGPDYVAGESVGTVDTEIARQRKR